MSYLIYILTIAVTLLVMFGVYRFGFHIGKTVGQYTLDEIRRYHCYLTMKKVLVAGAGTSIGYNDVEETMTISIAEESQDVTS